MDIPNRDELERKLGRELGKYNQEQMTRLMEYANDPRQLQNVPLQLFDAMGNDLLVILRPYLQQVYLTQAAEYLGAQSIGVDWALVNQSAADWAKQHAGELVKDVMDNTRAGIQSAVGNYFEQGQTVGQLENSIGGLRQFETDIAPLFGPVRAEMIAVTEITKAATEGELSIVKQITADNPSLQAVAIWNTNNDDLVCLVCGPRNQKKQGDGWTSPPPAHPRCRCWLNHKITVIKGG